MAPFKCYRTTVLNYSDKNENVVLGVGRRVVGTVLARERQELFGVVQMFHILIRVVTVTCLLTCIKTHQTGHLKSVHFNICKFYLIKKRTMKQN